MFSVVVRSTLIQLRTPDEMRGRVSAVNMVFIGASNELGEFESGVTAAWLGPELAVLVGGLDEPSTDLAVLLYRRAVDKVVRVSSAEVAESTAINSFILQTSSASGQIKLAK